MMEPRKSAYRVSLTLLYLGFAWALAYYTVTAVPQGKALERLMLHASSSPHQPGLIAPGALGLLTKAGLHPLRAELIFYVAAYLFAILALRRWLSLFLPRSAADLSPVWLFVATTNQLMLHYPGDALALGFVPLLLYLAHERRWSWFIAVFALACANSTTAYLALFAIAAIEGRGLLKGHAKRSALALAAGTIVWLATLAGALSFTHISKAEFAVSFKLMDNLRTLVGMARPWEFERLPFLSSLGLPFVWLHMLGWWNFLWILVFPHWRHKSPVLKRLVWVAAFQFALLLIFADLWEKRAFLDLVPFVLPLALQTFFLPRREDRSEPEGLSIPSHEPNKLLPVLYLCLAWAMAYYTLASVPQRGAKLVDCIMGRADLPFQYRILGPWTIYALSKIGLQTLDQAELLFYVLAYLFAFASMRLWLQNFLPQEIADLSPLWVIALTVNQLIYRYPWDPLTLGFIPLLLHLAYRGSWAWFIVAFAVGTFNRETTYLALMAIPLLCGLKDFTSRLKEFIPPVFAAAIIWALIKLILVSMFAYNAGTPIQWSLPENMSVLLNKSTSWDFHYYRHLRYFPIPLCWLSIVSWANFWWAVALSKWQQKSPVLKRLAWIIAIHFVIVLLVGNLWERRVYLELYPIILGLGLQTFFGQRNDEQ